MNAPAKPSSGIISVASNAENPTKDSPRISAGLTRKGARSGRDCRERKGDETEREHGSCRVEGEVRGSRSVTDDSEDLCRTEDKALPCEESRKGAGSFQRSRSGGRSGLEKSRKGEGEKRKGKEEGSKRERK